LKLQNILPSSRNLGGWLGNKSGQRGGIGGVLDQLGGKNQQQPSNQGADKNQGQQQKQNPIGDVLNQVLGPKKKPEATPTPPK
jgi:hypothetical protein